MRKFRPVCKLLVWAFVLFWLILIFLLSEQPAAHSNELSKGVTAVIVHTIEKLTHIEINLTEWNHWVRKNAHFFLYCVLGLLVMTGFKASGMRLARSGVFSFGVCVLCAISDEVHQLFVDGRGGQARDVMIDSAGALTGILLFALIYKIWSRRRSKRMDG